MNFLKLSFRMLYRDWRAGELRVLVLALIIAVSGMTTVGPTWVQFKVGYYLFAILFLIFDVEVAFLIPWAVVFKDVGAVAFIEIVIFLVILGLGLLYAWKKGALKWE